MAAGVWKVYTRAKRIISTGGNAMTAGGITLGVGVFKMSLHRASASANILKVSNGGISTFASIGSEISARGGYAAGGKNLVPATGKLTVGASTRQMKFTMSAVGIIFSAATSALNNIKYAAIRTSSGAGAGKVFAFCTLSTAQFSVTSGNTLTIQPNALGLVTLA
jgi:hypothetical protein